MINGLDHRGPDASGFKIHVNDDCIVALGHTRLSIIDISNNGKQPMEFGDLSISYNGEIYNYLEIRRELKDLGHRFKSQTDTEVILHSYAEWGEKCVNKFIGMFAFAIYDKKRRQLFLCRDRAGAKPLYYYFENNVFLFSSELKTFHCHPSFKKRININALSEYMDFGFIPSPYSIFKKCHKLSGGHTLLYELNSKQININQYWDVTEFYNKPKINIPYNDAKEKLLEILISSFKYRLVSDVPVGLFLSGGYDSSAVAAILQNNLTKKLKTFTIGFNEGTNEANYAKKIAKYLNTDHIEYYCTTKDAQDIIHRLPLYFDEPFADSSAIPTILLSQIARNSVKVALSADAGDEIFAGYNHYTNFLKNLETIRKVPPYLKHIISKASFIYGSYTSDYYLRKKLNTFSRLLINNKNIPSRLHHSYHQIDYNYYQKLFLLVLFFL